MSEGDFDQVNSIRDQEYVGDGGAIHFEPGLHYGFGEVTKSIDSGDLSKHCWNDEVGERLSSYGPQILAIDSLAPVAGKYLVNGDYGYEDKRWVWTWMPDRPKNFNEKGEVLVIAGDTNYQGVGEQLKTNLKEFKDQDRLGNLSLSKDEKEANAFLGKAFAEGAITASVAGLVTSALIAAYEKQNERPGAENGSHKFSRRKFLKVAGGGAAVALGIGGGRTAAAYGSALAPNSALQEISDKVLDLTQGTDFFSKSWLNGRTALLISKTNAVMEQGLTPSNAKAAVVMGNGHNLEAREIMDSKERRMEAIHEYAKDVVGFYRKVLKEFPSIDPNSAVNQILDMICQTDMLVVTDPGEDRVASPRGALHTSVKYVGSLYAPEVMDAVASLRIIGEDPIDTHNLVSQPLPKDEPHPASNAEPVIRANLPPVIIPKPPR